MTGVPGGHVTLHAAITAELAEHEGVWTAPAGIPVWSCHPCRHTVSGDHDGCRVSARRHLASRVLAVLADRLPHTPADQLATLIGGTVERPPYSGVEWVRGPQVNVDPWVPDSPPAAPEAQSVHPDDADPCGRTGCGHGNLRHDRADGCVECGCRQYLAAPEPRQDT